MSRKAVIQSIGMSVAERVMTNAEFESLVDTTDEWIRTRTGIQERRVSSDDEVCSTFAIRAAREALERANVDPESIEMVVVATVTSENQFPSVACLVQNAIGAKRAGAFDVGAACAGFIYGCDILGALIENGSIKRGLLIGCDVLTKTVDWNDRSTCILFGDGGGAVYMEAGEGDRGLLETVMRSDGAGAGSINLPRTKPGTNEPASLHMDGREVYRFAVKAMGDSCCSLLDKAGLTPDDIDLFVPHQANLRIIRAASERIGLPEEKVFINVQRYGNMSAGSIPVALYEAEQTNRLKRGDLVMTVGFGAGLVWGANLIRW